MRKLPDSSSYQALRIAVGFDDCGSPELDSAYKARSSCRSMTSLFRSVQSF